MVVFFFNINSINIVQLTKNQILIVNKRFITKTISNKTSTNCKTKELQIRYHQTNV